MPFRQTEGDKKSERAQIQKIIKFQFKKPAIFGDGVIHILATR
jgi:hypothetical protein